MSQVKLLKMYLVWSFIYLIFSIPSWIRSGWISPGAFVDFGLSMVLNASHYHLWYLLSAIYALPLFYIALKYVPEKLHIWIIFTGYIIQTICHTYQRWVPGLVQAVVTKLKWFSGLSNAIFGILPLLLIGALIQRKRLSLKRSVTGFLFFFMLLCAEVYMLRNVGVNPGLWLIFRLPASYFLFQTILAINIKKTCRVWRDASVYIYCIHPLFIEFYHSHNYSSFFNYGIVLLSSTISAFVILRIQDVFLREKR